MAKLSQYGAEAWPVSHAGRDGRRSLETVVVMSEHADGRGTVHLTADQALYVQSRLSQIAVAFLPHHRCTGVHPHRQATTHPDGPAVHMTHITLDFLHDKGWGGEDARSQ
jgi:hypothetical protein